MDFSGFVEGLVSFLRNHTVIGIVIGLVLLFFLYRKPKLFFALLFLAAFLGGLLYVINRVAGPASEKKEELIHEKEEEKESNNIPQSLFRNSFHFSGIESSWHGARLPGSREEEPYPEASKVSLGSEIRHSINARAQV